MIPVSFTFQGIKDSPQFDAANAAARRAGDASAAKHNRSHWNLDDFDAAQQEFNCVMDTQHPHRPRIADTESSRQHTAKCRDLDRHQARNLKYAQPLTNQPQP